MFPLSLSVNPWRRLSSRSLAIAASSFLGWLLLSLATAQAQVVINEVFYDSPDRTKSVEFIELHNSGNAAVDLSNWQFDSGINFTFASGTSLGAGSFIVVAQDPAAFQAQ